MAQVAEIADAVGQLLGGAGGVATGEVIPADVLILGAVGHYMIGRDEDRGGDGDGRFFRTSVALQAKEFGMEVTVLFLAGSPHTLDEHTKSTSGRPHEKSGASLVSG